MFLIIADRRKLISILLNKERHFTYRGLVFYYNNGRFYLGLKDGYTLSDGRKLVNLKKQSYLIDTEESFDRIALYVYDDNKGYEDYDFFLNKKKIMIGFDSGDIEHGDPYLKDQTMVIENGRIDGDIPFSVNGGTYEGQKLEEGDVITFLGVRIFYYEEFLYMNSFLSRCHLERYVLKEQKIRYGNRADLLRFPLKRTPYPFHIEEVEGYECPSQVFEQGIMKTLLPNAMMSLSMIGVSSMSAYTMWVENRGVFSILSCLIPCISMALSGTLLPYLFYKKEKKEKKEAVDQKRDEYLAYLDSYEKSLDRQIDKYLISEKARDFSIVDNETEPFGICADDPDFLSLIVGKRMISFPFNFKRCDSEINARFERIEKKLSSVGPVPLMVDLKRYNTVSIVTGASRKEYFLIHFLMQVAYRHSHEDVLMAVFAKRKDLIDDFYDLPHLFYNGRRLFFTDGSALQELERLKLDRPLLLFMYDDHDIAFHDPQIKVLRFIEDLQDLKKDRNVVVEYLGTGGNLYAGEKISFSYVKEIFDRKRVFRKLGRYNAAARKRDDIHFKDIFAEMNIVENYREKRRDLRADFAVCETDLLSFDLHEKKQGPHGLIGGCTGSGKSELIVSMLLSLCIRYSPEYLNIVLIDYKGGGIRDSLTYRKKIVPHVVAAVDNLEYGTLERLIVALRNECRRRQRLFTKLCEKSGMSIMDLDDYLDAAGDDMEKIAHLLVVVDEFAELKKEVPDAIKELISIARIGRSLGIHLILATQKPAGNVDEEIWSNSRFKIALKVFEEKDSYDLIRCNDAAYLHDPGSFVLKVDDSLIKASAIYSKRDFYDKEPYEVCILKDDLEIDRKKSIRNEGGESECSVFLSRIIEACEKLKPKVERLDFLPPEAMQRKRLAKGACFVFGEADDYINGKKGLVAYGLNEDILICSERKGMIASVLNTLTENKRRCITISHWHYKGGSIGDSLLYADNQDIGYLFDILLHKTEKATLLIEDLSSFLAYDDSYSEMLLKMLRRKDDRSFNIVAFTRDAQIGFKLLNGFRYRLLIGSNDPSVIHSVFGCRSRYRGENYYFDEEPICFVRIEEEPFIEGDRQLESLVRRIPDRILPDHTEGKCILGYDLKDRTAVYQKDEILICSEDNDLLSIYERAYGEKMKTCIYGKDSPKKIPDEFLWLGPGIFYQNLFTTGRMEDLSEEEGIYIYKGKKRRIRILSDA